MKTGWDDALRDLFREQAKQDFTKYVEHDGEKWIEEDFRELKLIYAPEPVERKTPSVFLAGPTPRSSDVCSWRKDAIALCEKANFKGTIYIPEDRSGKFKSSYDEQVQWEFDAIDAATKVMFWVPRDLETMPGFTTNVEFGWLMGQTPERIVLGSPPDAPKMTYLNWHADRLGIPRYNSLEDTVAATIRAL